MNLLNNKAAMFGLDARIALIIFATLSLIASGYMHSIINQSNYQKILAESRVLTAAIDRYQADMGVNFYDSFDASVTAANKEILFFNLLTYKTSPEASLQNRWNGPYIKRNYPTGKVDPYLNTNYRMVISESDMAESCSGIATCYHYLKFATITSSQCDNFEEVANQVGTTILRKSNAGNCDLYIPLIEYKV